MAQAKANVGMRVIIYEQEFVGVKTRGCRLLSRLTRLASGQARSQYRFVAKEGEIENTLSPFGRGMWAQPTNLLIT
jgi:hypothetical protein